MILEHLKALREPASGDLRSFTPSNPFVFLLLSLRSELTCFVFYHVGSTGNEDVQSQKVGEIDEHS